MSIAIPAKATLVPDVVKAGPIGPGAGVLLTEYLMPMMLPTDAQRKMRMALKLGHEISWVRAAERVISGKIGGDPDLQGSVGWHLEDPDGETIDKDYADPKAVEAYMLVHHPARFLMVDKSKQVTVAEYQGQLWEITSRHMGLAGQGYWFLDSLNDFGIPQGILYVRPDRLWPVCDDSGSLINWSLDPKNVNSLQTGTKLDLDEIIQFPIETPSEGFLAEGLIESAILKAQLSQAIDRHLGSMISSSGRLSGMFAPKGGAIDDDGTWDQLVRDMRNLSEQPDAAKRMQLMRAPMEYTRTQATLEEMAIVDLMSKNRDELLALWGIPLSQIGGSSPAGLNSGDIRKYDESALWQNAIVTRLVPIKQRVQRRLLDPFEAYIGWPPKLVLDIPQFDDDSPRFDKLQKSQFIGLTQDERRGLINFDPLDPAMMGPTGKPLGQEVWLPINQAPVADHTIAMPPPTPQNPPVPAWAGGAVAPTADAAGAAMGQTPGAQAQNANGIPNAGPEKPSLSTMASLAGQAGKAKADVTSAVMAALRKQYPPDQLAVVRQGDWTFDPAFPLDKINADRRPDGGRNPAIVAGVEAAMAIDAPIDPVTIIHTKRIGKPGYEPVDGWHRVLAAVHQGLKTIPAYIGEGDDAWTTEMIKLDDNVPTPQLPGGPGKAASHRTMMQGLRADIETRVTPTLRAAVRLVLDQQQRDVIARVRTHWDHVKGHPADHAVWWVPGDALSNALRPGLMGVAQTVAGKVKTVYGAAKAGPAVATPVQRVLTRHAARVTGINDTTKTAVAAALADVITNDGTLDDAVTALEGLSAFDEYRAEMVARTELMDAYNASALASYDDAGFGMVEATDGDQDQECADRLAGNPYTIDDAMEEEDHPNGTLDWVPLFDDGEPKAKLDQTSLLDVMGRMADALGRQPEIHNHLPEPVTNTTVAAPTVNNHLPAPVVNVAAPVVNVEAPNVQVDVPPPPLRNVVIDRGMDGKMTGAHQEEMDE